MKNLSKIGGFLILSSLLFSVNVFAQSSNIDTIINQERANLIARQISANIVGRITTEISNPEDETLASLDMQNPLAASADVNSLLPDSVWVATSWAEISDDDSLNVHVDADIYQVTGGIDKQLGNWFVGLSTTYAYTETEIGGIGSQSDTHSVTVTPYVAFIINKNFFISGLTSYTYTRSEPDTSAIGNFNLDSDTDQYTSELDLNTLKVIGDITLTGKAGFRYSHSDQYFDKPGVGAFNLNKDNDKDNWTYLVDAQVGYSLARFVKGLRMSAGALYEYVELEDGADDGVLYMSTGLDYSVNKALSVGVRYSHDVNNEDIDINTVALNLRMAL